MINHARTLLLNQSANAQPPEGCPGEELIDPSYKAVPTTTAMNAVRAILFGPTPDRCMLNYRSAQLLGMLQSTELLGFVTDLDPRLTYPSATDLVGDAAFGLKVLTLSGGGLPAAQGSPATPDLTGRCYYDFTVTLTGGDVQVVEHTPIQQNAFWTISFFDGLATTAIPLGNSGYSILLPNQDSSWKLWSFNRPQWDPGQLAVALETAGEINLLELFGVQPTGPYKTFYDCWTLHPQLPYRLGGLVLALIYRTEEIRTGVAFG